MNKAEKLEFERLEAVIRKQERTIARLQEIEPIVEQLQQTNRILETLVTIFHKWYQMRDLGFTGPY